MKYTCKDHPRVVFKTPIMLLNEDVLCPLCGKPLQEAEYEGESNQV